MEGLALLGGILVAVFIYQAWLFKAVKPRRIVTSAQPDALREMFAQKVATLGWSIISEGEPMVAQSPLITGIRQQIALEIIDSDENGTVAALTVPRYVERMFGAPTKAHTIRMRINSFGRAIRTADPAAVIDYA